MKANDQNRFSVQELNALAQFVDIYWNDWLDCLIDMGHDTDFAEDLFEKLNTGLLRNDEN